MTTGFPDLTLDWLAPVGDPHPVPLLFFLALALAVIAFFLRDRVPVLAKVIISLTGALVPAYVVGAGAVVAALLLIGRPQSCDMGGAGILALIVGTVAGIFAYGLSLAAMLILLLRRPNPRA